VSTAEEHGSQSIFKVYTDVWATLGKSRTLKIYCECGHHRDECDCWRVAKRLKLRVLSKADQTIRIAGNQEYPSEIS
jgi:hypothetical protein